MAPWSPYGTHDSPRNKVSSTMDSLDSCLHLISGVTTGQLKKVWGFVGE